MASFRPDARRCLAASSTQTFLDTVRVTGGGSGAAAAAVEARDGCNLTIRNCTLDRVGNAGKSYGLFAFNAAPVAVDSVLDVTGGTGLGAALGIGGNAETFAAGPTVRRSRLVGDGYGILATGNDAHATIYNIPNRSRRPNAASGFERPSTWQNPCEGELASGGA